MKNQYLILVFVATMLATTVMGLGFHQNHRLLSVIIIVFILLGVIYNKNFKKKDD